VYSLWEKCAQAVKVYPRLILSSAFIDEEKFTNIPKYIVTTESYPVEIIYHTKTFSPHSQDLYLDLAQIISEYHLKEEDINSHFLVFAPGKGEIDKIIRHLKQADNMLVLPAYSNLEKSDLDKIYDEVTNKRKIIIATNIAETGITIENIGMVFDSLLEKRAETSSIGGLRMVTTKIAKSSAEQRKGRTGRTKAGKYYVMTTREDFEKLEPTRKDEIERVPITDVIMSLVAVGLDPITVIKKLTSEKKENAFNILQYLKLIEYNVQYMITEKGNFVSNFEMSVYNSASLYDILKNIPVAPLHAAAILTMIDMVDQTYFYFPPTPAGKSTREHRLEYRSKFNKYFGETDIHVFANIWNDLMNTIGGLIAFTENKRNVWNIITGWTQANSLNNKQIKEMLKSLISTLTVLFRLGFIIYQDLQSSLIPVDDVITKIRPVLATNYDKFSLRLIQQKNKDYLKYVSLEQSGRRQNET
jgi:HrpA-like RNA helicase